MRRTILLKNNQESPLGRIGGYGSLTNYLATEKKKSNLPANLVFQVDHKISEPVQKNLDTILGSITRFQSFATIHFSTTNIALGHASSFERKISLAEQADIQEVLALMNLESYTQQAVALSLIESLEKSQILALLVKDFIAYKKAKYDMFSDYMIGLGCPGLKEISAVFFFTN